MREKGRITIELDWDIEKLTRFFRAVNLSGLGVSEFCLVGIEAAIETQEELSKEKEGDAEGD